MILALIAAHTCISRTTNLIAVVGRTEDLSTTRLILVDPQSSKQQQFTLPTAIDINICSASPGHLYATSYSDQQLVELTPHEKSIKIKRIAKGNISSPSWNLQTKTLAYIKDHSIYIQSLDGTPRNITPESTAFADFSPMYPRAWYKCYWLNADTIVGSYIDPYTQDTKTAAVSLISITQSKRHQLALGLFADASPGRSTIYLRDSDQTYLNRIDISSKTNQQTRVRRLPVTGQIYAISNTGDAIASVTGNQLEVARTKQSTRSLHLNLPKGSYEAICWMTSKGLR